MALFTVSHLQPDLNPLHPIYNLLILAVKIVPWPKFKNEIQFTHFLGSERQSRPVHTRYSFSHSLISLILILYPLQLHRGEFPHRTSFPVGGGHRFTRKSIIDIFTLSIHITNYMRYRSPRRRFFTILHFHVHSRLKKTLQKRKIYLLYPSAMTSLSGNAPQATRNTRLELLQIHPCPVMPSGHIRL